MLGVAWTDLFYLLGKAGLLHCTAWLGWLAEGEARHQSLSDQQRTAYELPSPHLERRSHRGCVKG